MPGGKSSLEIPGLDQLPESRSSDYLIDRHEVTNEEYKKFVDAGGYQKREFWKQPFVEDGRTSPWDEAVGALPRRDGPPRPRDLGGRAPIRRGRRSTRSPA